MNRHDRRRMTVAAIFTTLALPAMWLFNTGEANTPSAAQGAAAASGDTAAPTTDYSPEPPVFLEVSGDSDVVRPAIIDIAIPPAPGANEAAGRASYARYADPTTRPCTTLLAPAGKLLTVVNVDNGHITTCVNTLGVRIPVGVDLVMHTDIFVEIASLANAPTAVRISW